MKSGVIFLISSLFFYTSVSQNLVPNARFEEYTTCPSGIKQLENIPYWFSVTAGSPEYFNLCDFYEGPANTGKGYAGLIIYADREEGIEYIGVALKEPLQKDINYCVKVNVRAKRSPFYINKLGVLLAHDKFEYNSWIPIFKKPSIVSESEKIFVPNIGWQLISGIYKAKGGEQYLYFGNFLKKDNHNIEREINIDSKPGWNSYVYIDDFYVGRSDKTECCDCDQELVYHQEKTEKGDLEKPIKPQSTNYVVYFPHNEFSISFDSFETLERIVQQLETNTKLNAKIVGHTDKTGNNEYNLELSKNRITTIKNYLIQRNIDEDRLLLTYKGETQPAISTEKREIKNRRVEIIIFDGEEQ